MLYDIRLELHYDYACWVHGDRHHVRVAPVSIPGVQRVIAASLAFGPRPDHELTFTDFFGNSVTSVAYHDYHDRLDVRLAARVAVEAGDRSADLSPALPRLEAEIAALRSLAPDAPHHFLGASPRVPLSPEIDAYARLSVLRTT